MKRCMHNLSLMVFVLLLSSSVFASAKKRIAVFDFEDKTNHNVRWWRGGQTVGEGMSEMLTTGLVKSGEFRVIERSKMQSIMQEQSLGMSGAVTNATAAKVGKMLGVDVGVFGAVTQFGYSESEAGGRAPIPTPFGRRSVRLGVKTLTATVGIDIRLVNTSSGEIIAAESVVVEEEKKGLKISDARRSFSNETDFDESMVGKATRAAIDSAIVKITAQMENVAWSGSIIKCDGTSAIINAGSATGISVGSVLEVYHKGEELIDPETGLNLGSEETKVGVIEVVSDIADGKASKCKILEGSCGSRGSIVRMKKE